MLKIKIKSILKKMLSTRCYVFKKQLIYFTSMFQSILSIFNNSIIHYIFIVHRQTYNLKAFHFISYNSYYNSFNSYMKQHNSSKNSLSFISQFVKTKAEKPQIIQRLRQKEFYRIKNQILKHTNAELLDLKHTQIDKKLQIQKQFKLISETLNIINKQEASYQEKIKFEIQKVEKIKEQNEQAQKQKIRQIQERNKAIQKIEQDKKMLKHQRDEMIKSHVKKLEGIKKEKQEILRKIQEEKNKNKRIALYKQKLNHHQQNKKVTTKQIQKIKQTNKMFKKIYLNQQGKNQISLKEKINSQKKMNEDSKKKMKKFVQELKLIIQNPNGGTYQEKRNLVEILADVYGYVSPLAQIKNQSNNQKLSNFLKPKHDSVETNVSASQDYVESSERDSQNSRKSLGNQFQGHLVQQIPIQVLKELQKSQVQGINQFMVESPKKIRKMLKQIQQFKKQEEQILKRQKILQTESEQSQQLINQLKVKCFQKDNQIAVYNYSMASKQKQNRK